MNYEVGDTVIHWTYGLGKVIAIEEKWMGGTTQQYYVVQIDLLKLWVPMEGADGGSIRLPIDSLHFKQLFDIIRLPGEPLPDNPYKRRADLRTRMQKRTLEGLCRVIRDLTDRSRQHPLNTDDAATLSRAEKHLLDEWVLSMNIPPSDAQVELKELLHDSPQISPQI